MGQMLPPVPLPTDTVSVAGTDIVVRGLSRAEATRIAKFNGDVDAAESFVLARGVGISEDDAKAWRDATPPDVAGLVVDRIIELSGLTDHPEGATKSGSAGTDA